MELRLGFLASHNGTNMQAIIDACRQGRLKTYIEQYHSRNDMVRVQIGCNGADRFDAELREILCKYISNDVIETRYHTRITWGKPKAQLPHQDVGGID